jgi:competence protein ComGC
MDPFGRRGRWQFLSNQRGFSFVAVLFALLIVAFLYFGYFKMQNATSERASGVTAISASRAVACRTNRQQLERDIVMWSVDHPDDQPTLAALQAAGIRIPSCPEGGRYDIDGREVHCSVHQ